MNSVVDELRDGPSGDKIVAVHVVAPGFEEFTSERADRVAAQTEYRSEVLG